MQSSQNETRSSQALNSLAAMTLMDSNSKNSIEYQTCSLNRIYYNISEMKLSIDIIKCFPRLVCECVFQHLDAKELLEVSAVTREWNKFVGERPQVGKLKIAFNNNNRKQAEQASSVLKKSEREYQNIEFSLITFKFYLDFFSKRAGLWKTVAIQNCQIEDDDTWFEILRIIEPSVEEFSVVVNNYSAQEPIQVRSNLSFSRLKSLKCEANWDHLFKYFCHCTSLVKFHCTRYQQHYGSAESIRTILHNNHHLKDVSMTIELLSEHLFKYKLQKLQIDNSENAAVSENLHSFLESQAQTLESLEINVNFDRVSLELLLCNMPRLSLLKINLSLLRGPTLNWDQAFPVNTTIISLEVNNRGYEYWFRALRSLKHFKTKRIEDWDLRRLSQDFPALESLETFKFKVSEFPEEEIFPNIKKFKAEVFYKERKILRAPTGEYKFSALVRDELRKFQASGYHKYLRSY